MKTIRWIFLVGAVWLAPVGPVSADEHEHRSEIGQISVEPAVLFWYRQTEEDASEGVDAVEEFKTRQIHLHVMSRVNSSTEFVLMAGYDGEAEMEMEVEEAYIRHSLLENFSVTLGTFRPPWTLSMPRHQHELMFIRYPLIVDNNLAVFTPWSQTGVMATLDYGKMLVINAGVFNGLDVPGQFSDSNNMKDNMISARVAFTPDICFCLGHWGGVSTLTDPLLEAQFLSSTIEYTNTWVGLEARHQSWYFASETLWNWVETDVGTRRAFGYHASMAYGYANLTGLVRYELLDLDAPTTPDALEWTTLGLNLALAESLDLMINYIFQNERGAQVDNNELLIQLSFAL